MKTINQAGIKATKGGGNRAPVSKESHNNALSPRLAFRGNHDERKTHIVAYHTSMFYKYICIQTSSRAKHQR